jgi:hypothetical protein
METGLIIKYGRLVPGREQQAIDLFAETTEWFAEQLKVGTITHVEPFFFATGELDVEAGFWIIKGERDKVWKMLEDDRYLWLTTKAQFVVDHLEVNFLTVAERIPEQVERATKLAAEFVSLH